MIILLGGVAVLLLALITFAVVLGTAVLIVGLLQRLVLFVARWIG